MGTARLIGISLLALAAGDPALAQTAPPSQTLDHAALHGMKQRHGVSRCPSMFVMWDVPLAVVRHTAKPMVVLVVSVPGDGLSRWLGRVRLHPFDRHHLPSGRHGQQHQATVDGAIAGLAMRVTLNDGDGASPAVAFRATFLGAAPATRP